MTLSKLLKKKYTFTKIHESCNIDSPMGVHAPIASILITVTTNKGTMGGMKSKFIPIITS